LIPLGEEHVQSPGRVGVVGWIKASSERVSLGSEPWDADEYRY
jgi:hypothetical protein